MALIEQRLGKPRKIGRTNILDRGLGLKQLQMQLETSSDFIDVIKLGWGTSLVTPNLKAKIDLIKSFDIEPCLGGTLFEYCYLTKKIDEYIEFLKSNELTLIEISDGTITIPQNEKNEIISRFAKEFTVLSEVGSKDDKVIVSPSKWVGQIKSELNAGAQGIILEGRESGTAGLYRGDGEIRMGLVEEVMESGVDIDKLIFEAPKKAHQVFLIKQYGPDVNMGNILYDDVISLETLRLGIRADTLSTIHKI
ncbi:phosphosulfolactate synthase [Pseudoalteromonas sp. NZS100]|uniref:phosphosulfolactate synthase n=1 Tax=Pseudoalteromonas sp. NZS100 TaxID=2792046 RepID=UPI0018CE2D35|nr:phosphosulfolactate synthase [Pseudoalteromonas sp. NZS100]MBH0067366.1 phosphosulfolactate synthase [Pseudoalteromonas sp. NZS100]